MLLIIVLFFMIINVRITLFFRGANRVKTLHLRLDRAIVIEKFQFIVSKVGEELSN